MARPAQTPTSPRRSSPRLWQRVRRWLQRNLGAPAPRPMPILLEDLYPPPARAVYRGVRSWEQNLLAALEERTGTEALGHEVRTTARLLRRHLLLVQRLRHEVAASGARAGDHLYDTWVEHRVGWAGGIAGSLEALARVSRPFVHDEASAAPDEAALGSTLASVQADVAARNRSLETTLTA